MHLDLRSDAARESDLRTASRPCDTHDAARTARLNSGGAALEHSTRRPAAAVAAAPRINTNLEEISVIPDEPRAADAATENAVSLQDVRSREELILSHPPRILPLSESEIGEAAQENVRRLRQGVLGKAEQLPFAQIPEIVPTLLRHPDLWERIGDLSIQLMGRGVLKPRDRQLAILRVLWLCQAPYAWGEHVKHGKKVGLTSEEIERVTGGSSAAGWDEYERALLLAAEELHDNAMISDATWDGLAKRLNEQQLFELTVLIGQFTTVAYFQNALRLRLDDNNIGLGAR